LWRCSKQGHLHRDIACLGELDEIVLSRLQFLGRITIEHNHASLIVVRVQYQQVVDVMVPAIARWIRVHYCIIV